jgi:hypothetical protein
MLNFARNGTKKSLDFLMPYVFCTEELLFSVPPLKPTIEGFPSNGVANRGSPLNLICKASGKVPVSGFHWYKKYPASSLSNKPNYVVRSLTEGYAGIYYCIAINAAGRTNSDQMTLTILGKSGKSVKFNIYMI